MNEVVMLSRIGIAVSYVCDITLEELYSSRRFRKIIEAKMLFCVAGKRLGIRTSSIGKWLNYVNHCNIIYHNKQYSNLSDIYKELRNKLSDIIQIASYEYNKLKH